MILILYFLNLVTKGNKTLTSENYSKLFKCFNSVINFERNWRTASRSQFNTIKIMTKIDGM